MPAALDKLELTNVGPVVKVNGTPFKSVNVSTNPTLVNVTFPVFSTVIVYVIVSPKLAPAGPTSVLIAELFSAIILGDSVVVSVALFCSSIHKLSGCVIITLYTFPLSPVTSEIVKSAVFVPLYTPVSDKFIPFSCH